LNDPNEPTSAPDTDPAGSDATESMGGHEESSSWRPADYYEAPPAVARFPRWLPISCGVAAIVAILFMFAVGAFLRSGGLGTFVAIAIGQFQGEMKTMFDDEVPVDSKEKLDNSLRAVREGLRSGAIDQRNVVPLLEEIREVSGDGKISAAEAEELLAHLGALEDQVQPASKD
jgi:hypothetical protein